MCYASSASALSIASISLAVLDAPLNSLKEKFILHLEMRYRLKSGGKRLNVWIMRKDAS